jgi:1,4-alpha-glucan branching enzyme
MAIALTVDDTAENKEPQGSTQLGRIELALFAPYNESVELIGDFNDWRPAPMTKGADGWWRAAVDLADGDHEYKFRVKSVSYFAPGETFDVFDPYAPSVTGDEHENSVVRVKSGQRIWTDYDWKHDDVPLPQNEELIVYELFVADFAGTEDPRGRFDDVIARLDYLQDLGINCVELMPVKFFPGKGWGYNLRSLFAVASGYGGADDLCRLVDECHARGIRVVIDGVYNHADADSPLAKIAYAYWFYEQNPDPPEMQWGPKFNYGHHDENLGVFPARKYVIESIKFWVEKFHIDGIRFDATRGIANFDVLKELTAAAFEQAGGRKPFFTVAEHVPEDPAITGYPDGPVVAAWRFSLGAHFRAVLTEQPNDGASPADFEGFLTALDPTKNGYASGNHCLNYIVSHDHDKLMTQLAEKGNMFDDVAFARARLGLGLLATIPGIPMIWMGQEFGQAAEKSLDPRPLDWSLLQNERNAGLHAYVRNLFRLRAETAALQSDNFELCLKDPERRVFAFKRWTDDGNVVLVLANLRHEPAGELDVAECGLEDGLWRERTFGYDRTVEGGSLRDTLGPSEVKVFVKQ